MDKKFPEQLEEIKTEVLEELSELEGEEVDQDDIENALEDRFHQSYLIYKLVEVVSEEKIEWEIVDNGAEVYEVVSYHSDKLGNHIVLNWDFHLPRNLDEVIEIIKEYQEIAEEKEERISYTSEAV